MSPAPRSNRSWPRFIVLRDAVWLIATLIIAGVALFDGVYEIPIAPFILVALATSAIYQAAKSLYTSAVDRMNRSE